MKSDLKVLKNGGIYTLCVNGGTNILGSFLTLLKLVTNKKTNPFSYVTSDTKNENIRVKEFLFREHKTDYNNQDVKTLFASKNCLFLYDMIGHNIDENESIQNIGSEQFKLYSIVNSLMHSPQRPILVEFDNSILNPKMIERVKKAFEYDTTNNSRLIILTGNVPKVLMSVTKGELIAKSAGKYIYSETKDADVKYINDFKYVA